MENLALKIRLSVLWIFMAVAMYRCTAFWDPGAIEQMTSEMAAMTEFQIAGMLLLVAIWWLVPLTMAFLSVTLKDVTNRRANIILGIVFTGLNIIHFIEHLAQPTVHQLLIVGLTVVVTALIAWYAWKWPKRGV